MLYHDNRQVYYDNHDNYHIKNILQKSKTM